MTSIVKLKEAQPDRPMAEEHQGHGNSVFRRRKSAAAREMAVDLVECGDRAN